MRISALLLGIALLWSLTGCSGGHAKPSLHNMPKCEDIWVVGNKLPKNYKACANGSDDVVQRHFMNCGLYNGMQSGGTKFLYWHDDGVSVFYAHGNDAINQDSDWQIEVDDDRGELDLAKKICSLPDPPPSSNSTR